MRKPFDPKVILEKLAHEPSKPGDFEILSDGSWRHRGGLIKRAALVNVFASILHRNPSGRHWLVTPVEQHEVLVEDAALHVVLINRDTDGIVALSNTDERCRMDDVHSLEMRPLSNDGRTQFVPYMTWHRGLRARFARQPFYDLVDIGDEVDGRLIIESAGFQFDLGAVT